MTTHPDITLYILSLIVSFIAIFLKGFQQKNVIAGQLQAVFLTSYAMAFFDVATVTLIVKGGWWIALSAGTGGAFGMVAAIKCHEWLFRSE